MDAHKNLAYSTLAVSGTSAATATTVASGHGTRFPAVPFNATVWPSAAIPTPANAEIVRVTNRVSDVLTITRAQEGTTARALGVGDQIAATITAKVLTDIEDAVTTLQSQISPPGAIVQYGAAAAPTGWLLCDGSSQLRASFAALFAIIGTTYGSVDGTHFTLPDLRGRVPVGLGTHANVDALGDNDGSALANRQPGHRHTVTDPGHNHTLPLGAGNSLGGTWMNGSSFDVTYGGWVASTNGTGISIASAGASAPLDTPAYITLNYIIKT